MNSCQANLGQRLAFRSGARDYRPGPFPLGSKSSSLGAEILIWNQ